VARHRISRSSQYRIRRRLVEVSPETTAVVLLLALAAFMFFIVAWAKGWLKGVRRGSFTGQVVMHDWQHKGKQEAMEYVMDEQEEKEKKDASSGENEKPGGGGRKEPEER
jgi:hypothetical protein